MRNLRKWPCFHARKSHRPSSVSLVGRLGAQFECRTFGPGCHGIGGLCHVHSLRHQAIEVSVSVGGVMVEGDEMLDPGQARKGQRVLQRTVAPALVPRIFLGAILRVMNEEISISGEHGTRGPLPASRKLWDAQGRLMVGEIGQHSVRVRNPVAHRRPGVAHKGCRDRQGPDRHRTAGDFVEVQRAGHLPQAALETTAATYSG